MSSAIVLFTRDLRVHDHPGLTAASEYDTIVPLFVFDDALLRDAGRPNRLRFLLDSLTDLRESLRRRGADLIVRRGDVVEQTVAIARAAGAKTVFTGDNVSAYAQARTRKLQAELDVRVEQTATALAPGEIVPEGRDHYRVFTPYWRRWQEEPLRPVLPAPRRVTVAPGIDAGRLPELHELAREQTSAGLPAGGEGEARRRLERWLEDGLETYDRSRDELAVDRTSRLSPYLHFGCISPVETITRARLRGEVAGAFVRQLCWRDFYSQLLAANPQTPREDLNPRRVAWNGDPEGLENWRRGTTGYPIVDAGMRQLHAEGWMHNRARLVVASFLTRTLGIDWRHGAHTFAELLVDADVANNVGNWQWVAGTGVDTRPNRAFNPITQAKRRDPDGDYVRRYVPELAELAGPAVHEPWLAPLASVAPEYPPPMPRAA